MENIHEQQFKVIGPEYDPEAAVSNAGYALHRLITFFKESASESENLHSDLFGMLQASLNIENPEPDHWQVKSRLYIYDCLVEIMQELCLFDLPKGQRFAISIDNPSNS